jgi:hypothetical protein
MHYAMQSKYKLNYIISKAKKSMILKKRGLVNKAVYNYVMNAAIIILLSNYYIKIPTFFIIRSVSLLQIRDY